jgi:hypothetical protein
MRPGFPALRATRTVGGYREYAPPPDLARVVDACWVYSTPAVTPEHGVIPSEARDLL